MTTTELDDAATSPIVLKAIPEGAYVMPEPSHPDYQVNPDGATFAMVAHLPSLRAPDVAAWVAERQHGNLIMACFAYGMERGQLHPDYHMARITREEERYIRIVARAELAARLGPRGYRTDHLASTLLPGELAETLPGA